MEDNWTPPDGDQEENIYIYYIARYVLRVVHRKGNDNIEVHSDMYRLRKSNVFASKERSSADALPLAVLSVWKM